MKRPIAAERTYIFQGSSELSKTRVVTASLFLPVPLARPPAASPLEQGLDAFPPFRSGYRLTFSYADQEEELIEGKDSLEALMGAVEALNARLRAVVAAIPPESREKHEDLGLPVFVPASFGLEFKRSVEANIDAAVEYRLSTFALTPPRTREGD